jgi:hypothetical protein
MGNIAEIGRYCDCLEIPWDERGPEPPKSEMIESPKLASSVNGHSSNEKEAPHLQQHLDSVEEEKLEAGTDKWQENETIEKNVRVDEI